MVKQNKGLIILVIILLCALAVCGVYFVRTNSSSKQTTTNSNEKQKDTSKNTKEEELKDKAIIRDLEDKTSYLYDIGVTKVGDKGTFFAKDAKSTDFTKQEKLNSILYLAENKLQSETDILSPTEFKNNFPDEYDEKYDFDYMKGLYYSCQACTINASVITTKYKNIYNEEPVNEGANFQSTIVKYDDTIKKYLFLSYESPNSGIKAYTHNYKYTKDNKYYYVYTSVGILEYALDENKVYKDFEQKELYKELSSNEDFTLNESNYQDFSKYRVAFKYDESANDYYFDHVEKLNE